MFDIEIEKILENEDYYPILFIIGFFIYAYIFMRIRFWFKKMRLKFIVNKKVPYLEKKINKQYDLKLKYQEENGNILKQFGINTGFGVTREQIDFRYYHLENIHKLGGAAVIKDFELLNNDRRILRGNLHLIPQIDDDIEDLRNEKSTLQNNFNNLKFSIWTSRRSS
jgi:hypothetical protein